MPKAGNESTGNAGRDPGGDAGSRRGMGVTNSSAGSANRLEMGILREVSGADTSRRALGLARARPDGRPGERSCGPHSAPGGALTCRRAAPRSCRCPDPLARVPSGPRPAATPTQDAHLRAFSEARTQDQARQAFCRSGLIQLQQPRARRCVRSRGLSQPPRAGRPAGGTTRRPFETTGGRLYCWPYVKQRPFIPPESHGRLRSGRDCALGQSFRFTQAKELASAMFPVLFPVTFCFGDEQSAFGSAWCVLRIGETGFEPATARPPAGCATRLRHSP